MKPSILIVTIIALCCAFITVSSNGIKPIIGRGIGPSGKPKQHFIQMPNRKEAMEAARRQGHGQPPIHHNEPGRKSHFHPANRDGSIRKDGTHYQYGKKKNVQNRLLI